MAFGMTHPCSNDDDILYGRKEEGRQPRREGRARGWLDGRGATAGITHVRDLERLEQVCDVFAVGLRRRDGQMALRNDEAS